MIGLATKVNIVREQMATKDSLARLETTMQGEFEHVDIRFDSVDQIFSPSASR